MVKGAMKNRTRCFLQCGVAMVVVICSVSQAREWTDIDDRKVEASYVSHDENGVTMRLPDGREAVVPLERLSKADLEYLENRPSPDDETDEPGSGDELNWDDEWPNLIRGESTIEIEIEKEDAEADRYMYTSENYRFVCDVRLSKSVVSNFARMFEATHLLCRSLPLALSGGLKTDGKYEILLFETKEAYVRAGGPPSSAGVFISGPGKNTVMVPLTSLGVKKVGSGYMRDRDADDATLVHELIHQLTPSSYFQVGARGWFTEGIAEYGANSPYRSGIFKIRTNQDEIQEAVTGYGEDGKGGRALGEEIKAPRLKDFMLMDYGNFTGSNPMFNYGFSTLLVTYFCHYDGDGDGARLKAFLKAMRDPATRRNPEPAFKALRGERTWQELEEDVTAGWRRKGVKIEFPEWGMMIFGLVMFFHRNTEPPSHRATEPPNHRTTEPRASLGCPPSTLSMPSSMRSLARLCLKLTLLPRHPTKKPQKNRQAYKTPALGFGRW